MNCLCALILIQVIYLCLTNLGQVQQYNSILVTAQLISNNTNSTTNATTTVTPQSEHSNNTNTTGPTATNTTDGCFNMTAYTKTLEGNAAAKTQFKAQLDNACQTQTDRNACIKERMTNMLTADMMKTQIKAYLLDYSKKTPIENLINDCFSAGNKDFYGCYLTGLERHCPELMGIINSARNNTPYYF